MYYISSQEHLILVNPIPHWGVAVDGCVRSNLQESQVAFLASYLRVGLSAARLIRMCGTLEADFPGFQLEAGAALWAA